MDSLCEERERLQARAAFLPIVDAASFVAGETVCRPDTTDGVSRLPYIAASEPVNQFVNMVYDKNWVGFFDWVDCKNSDEAKVLFAENGLAVSTADAEQSRNMLTLLDIIPGLEHRVTRTRRPS